MKEETKSLFKQYSELDTQIKALETQKKELAPQLTEVLEENDADQVKSEFGTFFFTTRKKWSYPEEVKEKEVAFKEAKKEAEESGAATFEESKSLSFRAS